jgi:hypothetical protein
MVLRLLTYLIAVNCIAGGMEDPLKRQDQLAGQADGPA